MRVIHKTIVEEIDKPSTFPYEIRIAIAQSLEIINASEYLDASERQEHEDGNLDRLIFERLTSFLPSAAQTLRCQPVSKTTLFKNDVEIRWEDCHMSMEIEKGVRGRFELDIEKMRAFAYLHNGKRCFGVFVVPSDNSLPRDVTGHAGESAFQYALRTGRLVTESARANLEDILVVGYTVDREDLGEPRRRMKVSRMKPAPDNGPTLSKSKRHEGKYYLGKHYLYWWDIGDSRKDKLARGGEIHFIKKDTGERGIIESNILLPLLTETHRTSRRKRPWGIRVLVDHPDDLAIEPGPGGQGGWAYIPVEWSRAQHS